MVKMATYKFILLISFYSFYYFNGVLGWGVPFKELRRFRRQNVENATSVAPGNFCRVDNNQVLGQWRCSDGEIIDCNGLCNGTVDCADLSDETAVSCGQVFCLDTGFRCSYGGCIRAELECNGVEECADGSDEKTINCPGILDQIQSKGSCEEGFFQCKDGECIYDDAVCSGGAECKDGSDETEELCSAHFCAEPGFRCDYGACVGPSARCDDNKDCVDGSDESETLCGSKIIVNDTRPTTNKPISLPTSRPTPIGMAFLPTKPTGNGIGVIKPFEYENMPTAGPATTLTEMHQINQLYRNLIFQQEAEIVRLRKLVLELQLFYLEGNNGDLVLPESNPLLDNRRVTVDPEYENDPSETEPTEPTLNKFVGVQPENALQRISGGPKAEGDCDVPVVKNGRVADEFNRPIEDGLVKNGERVVFACKTGTSLLGVNATSCINGEFLDDIPVCTNMCSGIPLNTLSVQAECFAPTGIKIPCSPLLPPKTVAILTCKIGYKQPDRAVPDAYTCKEDGFWNAHVYKCTPICGEVTEGRRLIVGGTESNITQVPWHAGIYENVSADKMEQICGGTIINPTAIVSAAHCFWDEQQRQMKDANLYQVAVGKTLREFDADEPTAQKYQVSSIKIYEQYMNYEGLFVSDIAVVRLDKPIIFQSYIKPICVEYSLKGNQRYVVSGIEGRVAGWGLTASQGEPSAVLKTIDLPTVDYNTCLTESPPSFRPFITTDKFCGGFTTGESVCNGDSGGGFVIPKPSSDGSRMIYFLRGIVSVGPISEGSCDNTKYSAFTDIQLHNMFLYEYLIT